MDIVLSNKKNKSKQFRRNWWKKLEQDVNKKEGYYNRIRMKLEIDISEKKTSPKKTNPKQSNPRNQEVIPATNFEYSKIYVMLKKMFLQWQNLHLPQISPEL